MYATHKRFGRSPKKRLAAMARLGMEIEGVEPSRYAAPTEPRVGGLISKRSDEAEARQGWPRRGVQAQKPSANRRGAEPGTAEARAGCK